MRSFTRIVVMLVIVTAVAAALGPSGRARTGRATSVTDHRGGTLKLLAKAAAGTLDPQVNYTLEYWQLYQATYDGLLAFKKAGGSEAFNVVPDLAANLPTPTNGGKKWVFKLRKGIKFSNGKTVTPNDVAASFQAHLQGEEPDLRARSTPGSSARRPASRHPADLHAQGRRDRERRRRAR